jgi:hypothetical protein
MAHHRIRWSEVGCELVSQLREGLGERREGSFPQPRLAPGKPDGPQFDARIQVGGPRKIRGGAATGERERVETKGGGG